MWYVLYDGHVCGTFIMRDSYVICLHEMREMYLVN